ncbi:helix-turn-helix transcriptional regulator [Cellulomonas composti]|uniref:Transcriptional regulator n=1 Tax=Cellulomonas composti TaxID=266130 RepID=A0A511J9M8_9CELL|nr:helix-turn-helix transcriptional regulator [Cellulomonas composti]GEL94701.1 transcriptional regulator [Cellulomonas composti]
MGRQRVGPSRGVIEALGLLGVQIRQARIDREWTRVELADRIGVSAPTVDRIESGYPGVSIGNALMAAAAVGVPLYGTDDPDELARMRRRGEERLALLPKAVRHRVTEDEDVDLDF